MREIILQVAVRSKQLRCELFATGIRTTAFRARDVYNVGMARGWDSKAVEDQIQAKETTAGPSRKHPTAEEKVAASRREAIRLMRVRTATFLQNAADPGYRSMLERTLLDLDAQLAEVDRA